jgi:putative Mg2+ transporter-C (MgtC) family protein
MISTQEIVIRLVVAALLGSLVGFERERLDWAAGLRTHMLVCLGSALAIIISAFGFKDILGTASVVLDPSRIAAQVISGIGFLGAGTILFLRQEIIRGLTTAAGLWAVAAIGLAIGSGLYFAGAIATVIVLIILAGLKPLERRLFRSRSSKQLTIRADRQKFDLRILESILSKASNDYVSMTIYPAKSSDEDLLQLRLKSSLEPKHGAVLLDELRKCAGIKEITTGGFDRPKGPESSANDSITTRPSK